MASASEGKDDWAEWPWEALVGSNVEDRLAWYLPVPGQRGVGDALTMQRLDTAGVR